MLCGYREEKGRYCIIMQYVASQLILTASPALSRKIDLHNISTKIYCQQLYKMTT